MSILNETLHDFRFEPETTDFLELIAAKTRKTPEKKAVIDELYGLIPPLEVSCRDCRNEQERNWEIERILRLDCSWDDFSLELYSSGNQFHAGKIALYGRETELELTAPLNLTVAGQIRNDAEKRLQLLSKAFGNILLRMMGVRKMLTEFLAGLAEKEMNDTALEIIVRLLSTRLTREETVNQEVFFQRATVMIAEVLAYRAGFQTKSAAYKQFASVSAARKSHRIFDELHPVLCQIWGSLANADRMTEERISKGKYCYTETYHPDGRIEIGEIIPALPTDESTLEVRFGKDCYKQIFSSYETAAYFRAAALRMIQS